MLKLLEEDPAKFQEIQHLDERWELASKAANEGIWDWDMRTNKVYRSDLWFELFGYKQGDLADTPWAWESMIHPEDLPAVLESRGKHIEGLADRYYAEHRMKCKDGVYRWFLTRGKVIRDENGRPVRMLGFYTDIQQMVEIREKLMLQNAALKVLQQVSLLAIETNEHDVALTIILNRIREFFAADKAYLALHDPVDDVMRRHSMSGSMGPSIGTYRRGQYFIGSIWEAGDYLYQDDFNTWEGRPDTPDSSQIVTACGLPMKVGNQIVGVITISFTAHREISVDEVDILRQFTAIAALVVRNRQMARLLREESRQRVNLENSIQHSGRIAFLNALADGKPMSTRDLAAQAKEYGLSLKSGYIAVAGRCDCAAGKFTEIGAGLEASHGLIAWMREGKFFALYPSPAPDRDRQELTARAQELRWLLETQLGGPICTMGVGLYCASLKEVAAGLKQAAEALDLGSRLHPDRTVHHYLDIGLIQVLSRHGDKAQVEAFIWHTLGRLIEYDRQKNSHLLETLDAILHSHSLRTAAEALFIHTKTLLFRKSRIEELLGESLEDAAVRLNLSLALKLHGLNSER